MESHYTRKESQRQYLAQDLSIRTMWELYKEKSLKDGEEFVKEHTKSYRNIFCEDYNLSFFKPKKDQCSLCARYENLKRMGKLDDKFKQMYIENQDRKE